MSTAALIVAAGRGQRLGGSLAKQYLELGGCALLTHSVSAFANHEAVGPVRVVISADDEQTYRAAVSGLELLEPVIGGAERQESVRLGLESLEGLAPDRVLIHDAARPFVSAGVIDRVLAALEQGPGAVAAVALADTLKRQTAASRTIAATVDRAGLWRAQTPQGFAYAEILAAHRAAAQSAGPDFTDDAAVAEAAGLTVELVAGDEDNFKITTTDDMERARRLFDSRLGDVRVGSGFDVHRFGPGDHVMLCGLALPHERGLVGLSDADVALHALTDALLSALAEGDIGSHFPPGEERWQDADSATFVRFAMARLAARGGRLAHVDLTIVCQQPKIAPQREAMRARLAELLELEPGRIAVKGTTSEGLGFTGRGEGIAVQATATVRLPG
ncbi:MAG TPA: bifunctional 2-C-methyl-D-erythritol 4-phosphate cytidylyltransferase/2-C-methyl-D-erythritol 2,4-cyclodiphosphate synthase [Alphaproteobacteria bacterium]|jgi:2-C-methyl-D-erythritol 4-phosphate cytidylyltransferase/2-C-methyl-D-erythritol 2,4-cyclodiphosphate synthase|nr:bifunctional 2-C-methyl-D-erythritol 4-phosphate cytidylyltransferase/2-C-methyl-D-erythritol 2,4-cyclodiphosphate synthase [Alphaproteobacteria bacterium]